MTDMRVSHEKIVVSDFGDAAALFRSTAHSNALAKRIPFAHNKLCALAVKRQVLRIAADCTERMKNIFGTEFRWPLNHSVAVHDAFVPKMNVRPNHRKRANRNTSA